MSTLVTIGVYDFTAESFAEALSGADVRLLLDVRQRRGVRGSAYAWANAVRLQESLAQSGIAYAHHLELASGHVRSRHGRHQRAHIDVDRSSPRCGRRDAWELGRVSRRAARTRRDQHEDYDEAHRHAAASAVADAGH